MTAQSLTDSEMLDEEWFHCYETRIAILCGPNEPKRWMIDLAKQEADDYCAALKKRCLTNG